jgi:hypothetical protein
MHYLSGPVASETRRRPTPEANKTRPEPVPLMIGVTGARAARMRFSMPILYSEPTYASDVFSVAMRFAHPGGEASA